jgi:hypothetical protein
MRLLRVHRVGAARAGAAGVRAHVCDRPKPTEVQCSTRCVCTPGCCANTTGHITSDERAMEGARPKLGAEGLGLSRAFGFGFKLPAGLDAAAALVERANRQQTLRDLASWAARYCVEALGRRRCALATRAASDLVIVAVALSLRGSVSLPRTVAVLVAVPGVVVATIVMPAPVERVQLPWVYRPSTKRALVLARRADNRGESQT